jgi:plasmid stabilization system protein ParE
VNAVLAELRALIPNRRLTHTEALILAERQAQRFLRLQGVSEGPVPTEAITCLPFLTVAVRRPLPSSGATRWIKPHWVVLLNGNEAAVRQRFSLAHEFKHILDHPHAGTTYGSRHSARVRQDTERICDYFAGCLLVPRTWLRSAWTHGVQDPATLADLFAVSQQAIQVRLTQLGLVDSTVRCSEIDDIYLRSSPLSLLTPAA